MSIKKPFLAVDQGPAFMSTKKSSFVAALTVFGFLRLATAAQADPQASDPSSGTPPANAAGQVENGDAAPSPGTKGIVLLTDGQVVEGTIIQDDSGYLLKTPYGSKRFPRGRVERTFQTLQEAYEYKASQFPEEDTQERLKLAQWCIAHNLEDEAKVQLQGILKISPKHPPAKAMLEKIEQAEVNRAKRRFDPGVQKAQAPIDEMPATAGPKELDPSALGQLNPKNAIQGADVPDIFNLPRPQALKLMEEFNRVIHPVLQNSCAKCHNERYPGNFQLRQVRNRRELNRDTLKLNLEAALQLIDPSNPSKSELLSSTLRPHGYNKNKRPIFKGSNDSSYQKISAWVDRVCKPLGTDGIRQASAQVGTGGAEERFAADRTVDLGEPAQQIETVAPNRRKMSPPPRPSAPATSPEEYPLMNTYDAESMKAALAAQNQASTPKVKAQKSVIPSPVQPQAGEAPMELPELPTEDAPPPSVKKKKAPPVKLDPALLERALKAGPKAGGN